MESDGEKLLMANEIANGNSSSDLLPWEIRAIKYVIDRNALLVQQVVELGQEVQRLRGLLGERE